MYDQGQGPAKWFSLMTPCSHMVEGESQLSQVVLRPHARAVAHVCIPAHLCMYAHTHTNK